MTEQINTKRMELRTMCYLRNFAEEAVRHLFHLFPKLLLCNEGAPSNNRPDPLLLATLTKLEFQRSEHAPCQDWVIDLAWNNGTTVRLAKEFGSFVFLIEGDPDAVLALGTYIDGILRSMKPFHPFEWIGIALADGRDVTVGTQQGATPRDAYEHVMNILRD